MTRLAGQELEKLGIGFVSLNGLVPSRQRGALMQKFREDPACKVFLSTDAGGAGLNLQSASAVINFEPPWNPARLEQRIGRVHRLGQSRAVTVIHMLTAGSIEERVWETLKLKKSLFAGVFDSPTGEVSFAKLGRKPLLQAVKEIFAEQPRRPKPVVQQEPPKPAPLNDVAKAASGLIEAGVHLIESMTKLGRVEDVLSDLIRHDEKTNQMALSIPLPASMSQERLLAALGGLLGTLTRAAGK